MWLIKKASKEQMEIKKAEKMEKIEKIKKVNNKEIKERIITLEEKNKRKIDEMDKMRRTIGVIFNAENMVELVTKQL